MLVQGGRRQADEVRWSWKVTEMGWGTDKDEKGRREVVPGHTMTVRLKMTTSFHPQGDGQAKQMIQTIVQIIWVTICPDQQDWVLQLPMTEFALNSSAISQQGMPPLN